MGRLKHLLDLGRSNILAIDAADAATVQMNFEHDLCGGFAVFVEKLLQHCNHKLHGREVIVEQHDLKHLWRLKALSAPFEHHGAVIV